jgi:mannose-1-phosphate guanylyltransferase
MNIILLSGGSGKRLWPLSNDTRSKQFLKLLKNEQGEYESMVQRVYRQIQTVCDKSNVVVATSASQVESIRSQLGDHVDIVIEPERRDTFPAIALSSAYLALEKKLDPNEVVLVLPVDPYADIEYFYTLLKMEAAVKENAADMVLMGIKPTYPSAKYGYILPKNDENMVTHDNKVYQVNQFVEKPSEDRASELIKYGAVWNGGIFAFRLGYLMNIVKQYGPVKSFDHLRNHYGTLKKISFDYEVVEKASSVAMISYEGNWKDLGTWNTLSEEMDEDCKGYATAGEDTSGTNIINELSIPVVVLGVKDLIVAASPDGILIADKQKSSYLKTYVDKINQRPMFEECRWGEYKVLDYKQYEDGKKSLTRHMHIKAGYNITYQCHTMRDEIWTIVDGSGDLIMEGHRRNIQSGDVVYIHKGQKHDLIAHTEINLIEVQIGEELALEDTQYFTYEQVLGA